MTRWACSPITTRSAPGRTRLGRPDEALPDQERGLDVRSVVSTVATVRIPPVLRPAVGGEKELTASGSSVGEILRSVADSHPQTESQLFAPGGDLNRYVNVYLNDEDVRVLEGLDTAVGQDDTLVILPAMAGGSSR